jgi:hypothetical protein
MLSLHELTTFLRIKDAPERIDAGRAKLGALRETGRACRCCGASFIGVVWGRFTTFVENILFFFVVVPGWNPCSPPGGRADAAVRRAGSQWLCIGLANQLRDRRPDGDGCLTYAIGLPGEREQFAVFGASVVDVWELRDEEREVHGYSF